MTVELNRRQRWAAWPVVLVLLIAGTACTRPEARSGTIQTRENLLQSQSIPDAVPLFAVTQNRLDEEGALERVKAVAKALDLVVELDALRYTKTSRSDVFRFRDRDHKFTVFASAGSIRYRNRLLYLADPDEGAVEAPAEEKVIQRAERDLQRLASVGLLDPEQIDRKNIHVTHQETQSGTKEGGKVKIGPVLTLDTRVDFTRQIGQLRVAGNGVRLIYHHKGSLAGLDLAWREVKSIKQDVPLAVGRDEAIKMFRDQVALYTRSGSTVDLMQAELVYPDLKPRDDLRLLIPGYLFMYRVRTPVPELKGEFVVGKKRFILLPAVKFQ